MVQVAVLSALRLQSVELLEEVLEGDELSDADTGVFVAETGRDLSDVL